MKNYDLSKYVYPSDWKNPKPKDLYDLVVIGGGPGGMTAATIAAEMGATVALIEMEHMGGECFNVGCIPSKALLRSSRCAAEVRSAGDFGIEVPNGWRVNFPAVMSRVRRLQSTLGHHNSAEQFKNIGIDVFLGRAEFAAANRIDVDGQVLLFKKAIVATGTNPIIPMIEGLEQEDYITNQTVFKLNTLPARLAVLGAGPIGCELSQAFLRFGSQVTLITRGANILPRDDRTASERLQSAFKKEGMQILFQTQVKRVEKRGKEKILYLNSGDTLVVDEILIAVGRVPQVKGLGLEKANVLYDQKNGILADDTLKTSNPNIYIVGDVGLPHKFTHISKETAKMAVDNAINSGNVKVSPLIIPWCTYTDPEIAHIGLSETEATLETLLIEMKDVDRAILDGDTDGFIKIHVNDQGQIRGATIMAKHAGDMISEIAVAITSKKGISAIAEAIHPFPTQAEAIRMAASAFSKTHALRKAA